MFVFALGVSLLTLSFCVQGTTPGDISMPAQPIPSQIIALADPVWIVKLR